MRGNKITEEDKTEMLRLRQDGWDTLQLGEKFGVDHTTISYHLNRMLPPEEVKHRGIGTKKFRRSKPKLYLKRLAESKKLNDKEAKMYLSAYRARQKLVL